MRRAPDTSARRDTRAFLLAQSKADMRWLERIGPDYSWILSVLYSGAPLTVAQAARRAKLDLTVVPSRRDQALYLLGMDRPFDARVIRAADNRLAEFEVRQRLLYVRDNSDLGPADATLIELALKYGALSHVIARRSKWSEQQASSALSRLAGLNDSGIVRPGDKVRLAALREMRRCGENPKAEAELQILEALAKGRGIDELAELWQARPTALRALASEVRRELSLHRKTRIAYRELIATADAEAPGGPHKSTWINARLLPLYTIFRAAAAPYSTRERTYLRLRLQKLSIGDAAQTAFDVSGPVASVIERAFLQQIFVQTIEFPEVLPLPPFLSAQNKLMTMLRYTPMGA